MSEFLAAPPRYSSVVPAIQILKTPMYRSTLQKCFALLEPKDQQKLGIMVVVQLLLSLLDLLGVALVGILATTLLLRILVTVKVQPTFIRIQERIR